MMRRGNFPYFTGSNSEYCRGISVFIAVPNPSTPKYRAEP